MPKASICCPIPWSKSVTRPTCGSWPTPANYSQSSCPRRGRTGASREPPHAFSEPGQVASVAGFDLRFGTISGDRTGHAVARLDDESSPELLPWNLRRQFHTEQLSRCPDYRSLRRKDG